jgi:hypothetical protein
MRQGLARAERDGGNWDAARQQIEAAIAAVEEVRGRVNNEQLRASYLATGQDTYQFHIDLLMQMHQREPTAGYEMEALQISERARARSLLEILGESQADIRQGVDAKLLTRITSTN